MASAVLPSGHEPHWAEPKVYMRKYTHQASTNNNLITFNPNPNPNPNPIPSPHFNPNNPNSNYNPTINRVPNQTPNPINPNPAGRYIHDFSYSPRSPAVPVAVDVKKESLPGGRVTFHLGSYSRRELKELRNRFLSELEQVRRLRYNVEAREIELRSNCNSSVLPPVLPSIEFSCSNAAASVSRAKVKKKKNAGSPLGGKNKGQKRAMPFASVGESKRPAKNGVTNSAAAQKVVAVMMRRCGQMLAKLMKHKHGWVFNKPVDTVALGLLNYHEIIKRPMDLGTVKSKLSKHMYKKPLDFASDVRLTFHNALMYNPKEDDAHIMATILLNMFEEMFNPAYRKFEAEYKRVITAEQNLRQPVPNSMQLHGALSQQSVMKPLPDLMRSQVALSNQRPTSMQASVSIAPWETATKHQVGRQKKMPKPKVKEPNKREMSHEERGKLGLSLQNLPLESMDEILHIIRKRNPGLAAPDGNGEVELDIQALDNETVWELDRFVSRHRKAAENKTRRNKELRSDSTLSLQINKQSPVVELMIQEASAAVQKAEEDVDIGDEMLMNDYPPLEIKKDAAPSPASNGRSSSTSDSSSGSGSSSSNADSDSGSSGSDSDADSVQSPQAA